LYCLRWYSTIVQALFIISRETLVAPLSSKTVITAARRQACSGALEAKPLMSDAGFPGPSCASIRSWNAMQTVRAPSDRVSIRSAVAARVSRRASADAFWNALTVARSPASLGL
jgi:hypothetical protein